MEQKNFFFNRVLILISFMCGAIISIYLGIGVYNRACPNFNSLKILQSVPDEIKEASVSTSGSNVHAIGQQLSPYNKKIANARLLLAIKPEEASKVSDPYLSTIRDKAGELAGKSFAVEEYGRLVAIGIGICSVTLTTSVCWFIICGLIYGKRLICRTV
ncbi:MAG: hypothetical protein Q7T74_02425 [Candidatus Saccharibacteria bacterium]|nr:hypothetical protein [Candidatus Saccharibacteria bacterium]